MRHHAMHMADLVPANIPVFHRDNPYTRYVYLVGSGLLPGSRTAEQSPRSVTSASVAHGSSMNQCQGKDEQSCIRVIFKLLGVFAELIASVPTSGVAADYGLVSTLMRRSGRGDARGRGTAPDRHARVGRGGGVRPGRLCRAGLDPGWNAVPRSARRDERTPSASRGSRLRGARIWSVPPRLSGVLCHGQSTLSRERTPGTNVPAHGTFGRAAQAVPARLRRREVADASWAS